MAEVQYCGIVSYTLQYMDVWLIAVLRYCGKVSYMLQYMDALLIAVLWYCIIKTSMYGCIVNCSACSAVQYGCKVQLAEVRCQL